MLLKIQEVNSGAIAFHYIIVESTGTRHYTGHCEHLCWCPKALMLNRLLLKNSHLLPGFVTLYFYRICTVYLKRDSCVSWIRNIYRCDIWSDTKLMRVVQAQFRGQEPFFSFIHLEHQALQTFGSIDWSFSGRIVLAIQLTASIWKRRCGTEFACTSPQLCGVDCPDNVFWSCKELRLSRSASVV